MHRTDFQDEWHDLWIHLVPGRTMRMFRLPTNTASNNICVKQTSSGSVSDAIMWRPVA